jgi:membrane-associated phospholipid phosphatase
VWFGGAVLLFGTIVATLFRRSDPFGDVGDTILRWFADHEGTTTVNLAKGLNALTSVAVVMSTRAAIVGVLALYKRWRHLVVALATFVVSDFLVSVLLSVERPPPSVPALVTVSGYHFPSRAVASFAITLFAAAAALVPSGRQRSFARWATALLVALVIVAQLVVAADYPVDAAYAGLLAFALATAAFRLAAPDDSFPVTWARGGTSAHLDLSGDRADAVKLAVRDQLGIAVREVEPFGLAGSGGSSPLRMTLVDGSRLFGKIYATSHARADRWYRIGRTILYGTLEDETPFGTPRRLAEYEDYALRFLADNGVRVAKTYGPVELTPNREYMLVTGFFTNATNLGDAEVDDQVIDEGLQLVRTFWDIGVSHRDIKPANLLVREGHLQLVDVSGLEVRPSPWRQAVDLANIMLTLALRSDPERVYERAVVVFTPEEIGEGFASAVGLAIPTELRSRLKQDPRPLLERFKELAPAHSPVSIQTWSVRRIMCAAGAVVGAAAVAGLFLAAMAAGLR